MCAKHVYFSNRARKGICGLRRAYLEQVAKLGFWKGSLLKDDFGDLYLIRESTIIDLPVESKNPFDSFAHTAVYSPIEDLKHIVAITVLSVGGKPCITGLTLLAGSEFDFDKLLNEIPAGFLENVRFGEGYTIETARKLDHLLVAWGFLNEYDR